MGQRHCSNLWHCLGGLSGFLKIGEAIRYLLETIGWASSGWVSGQINGVSAHLSGVMKGELGVHSSSLHHKWMQ